MTEPLLRRLAERGERLCVGALPWVAPIYRAMPQVAEVIELPFAHGGLQWQARRRLAQQLRGRFDVAYVCPNSIKSALLPWLAGIPKRIGYCGEQRFALLTQRLPNPAKGKRPPMVAFYSALSGTADVAGDRPKLQLGPVQMQATLLALGMKRSEYYVFAPGAEYGQAKRWPIHHFAELALQLQHPVVLLGSAKESDMCSQIVDSVNAVRAGQCINLAGKTTLEQALCAIAASKYVVSNDSGLMHVAAAFGVRQVAVFGSSSPLHTPPLNEHAVVVWLKNEPDYQPPLDCAPCYKRTCPFVHTRCLNDISAAKILTLL